MISEGPTRPSSLVLPAEGETKGKGRCGENKKDKGPLGRSDGERIGRGDEGRKERGDEGRKGKDGGKNKGLEVDRTAVI